MASESDDFTLVVKQLLNEIQPLKEELEMMADEDKGEKEEFREAQLKAIKERTRLIDDIVSQLDSIMEAYPEDKSVGGRRKTKRRRNKKKRKTRRKKGGNVNQAGSVVKRVKDIVGRLIKTRGDIGKLKQDTSIIANTKSDMVEYLKNAPGTLKKKTENLGNIIKNSVGKHSPCLAAAILAQESCILKNIQKNKANSASGSRGYVSGTDAEPSSLINKVCSVKSLQKIIPDWDEMYKSKKTHFGCGEKIHSDMIEISDLKNKENERQLMKNPQHVANLEKIKTRLQELKRRDEIAEKTGDLVLAEGDDNIFEDKVVVFGGRRKTKRRRNKKKRKTKKKRRRRRKK